MGKVITIPYKPRDPFKLFHESKKRWAVMVCHRRAGKTVACVNHLIRDALVVPNRTLAYIGPTYSQAKRIAWQYFKDYGGKIPTVQFNEAELRVNFGNGSRIYVLGSENPDSLRGMALDGVVFDEYSQQPPNVFGEIISPALADRKGYAVWIGTLIGKNQLWRLHEEHKGDAQWFTLYLRASESGILDKEELEIQRKNMSESEYLQEFELDVNATLRGSYYMKELEKARLDKRLTSVPYDKSIPVSTYWDLGIGDDTAIIMVQRVGQEFHIIDAYKGSGMPLSHYADVLLKREYVYDMHYLPHDAAARELGTGKSREEIVKSLLKRTRIMAADSVADGISAVRTVFNKCWFDAVKCEGLIDSLAQYRREWDEKAGMFKERPKHDWTSHYADAMRGFAMNCKSGSQDMAYQFRPPSSSIYRRKSPSPNMI